MCTTAAIAKCVGPTLATWAWPGINQRLSEAAAAGNASALRSLLEACSMGDDAGGWAGALARRLAAWDLWWAEGRHRPGIRSHLTDAIGAGLPWTSARVRDAATSTHIDVLELREAV